MLRRKESEEKQEGQRAADGERAKPEGESGGVPEKRAGRKTGSRAVHRRKEPEEKQEGQRATGNKRVKREDQRVSRTSGEWLTAIRRCTRDSAGGEPKSGRYRNDSRKPDRGQERGRRA